MQTAIDAEIDTFFGRQRCERREEDAPSGYLDGHQPAVAVKTNVGAVEIARPTPYHRSFVALAGSRVAVL
jgi:hypothetical protein